MAVTRDLVAKYAGLLQACKIIAAMHINAAGDARSLEQAAKAMQLVAREAVENGS